MTYYDDLTKDEKRVSVFREAIIREAHGITFDLGTGSGILAGFASKYAKKVYAFEINPLVIRHYTRENLEKYDNITLIEADLTDYEFQEKPDVVICEMLDTALIDEQQATVINNILNYTKNDTIFIPKSTYDTITIGSADIAHIHYVENDFPSFTAYSDEQKYNEVHFQKRIDQNFKSDMNIKIKKSGTVNCIRLTTYTRLTKDLITKPTPMLNPPLLIPVKETKVNEEEEIIIHLEYIMGGGLNSIKANIQ
ncbi:MAG: hypothetical protein BZ138_04875 [Methanosphaera sp. rholeuAM270]|nr:MAG: hypothetical protein BZ138_04875 [Methanosphaera sp. rholeuAM270]